MAGRFPRDGFAAGFGSNRRDTTRRPNERPTRRERVLSRYGFAPATNSNAAARRRSAAIDTTAAR
jgi:hypothetical protein